MTFAIYIVLVLGLFTAILNILPVAAPLSPTFAASLTTIIGYMKAWNFMFPINELLFCVGIVTAAEIGIYSWKILKRVLGIVGSMRGG